MRHEAEVGKAQTHRGPPAAAAALASAAVGYECVELCSPLANDAVMEGPRGNRAECTQNTFCSPLSGNCAPPPSTTIPIIGVEVLNASDDEDDDDDAHDDDGNKQQQAAKTISFCSLFYWQSSLQNNTNNSRRLRRRNRTWLDAWKKETSEGK